MSLTLGRIPVFDEKSKQYSIRKVTNKTKLKTTHWCYYGDVLNQGDLSACVGFSWTHWLSTDPYPVSPVFVEDGIKIYRRAQELDEIPGENYQGTSVLAGAKAMLENFNGVFTSYHWAFNLNDLLIALSNVGPVVLGINWHTGMYDPTSQGFIYPTGSIVGGHAILAVGLNLENKAVKLLNSWGPDWGMGGTAWIRFSDLEKLLKTNGEACVPTGKINQCTNL